MDTEGNGTAPKRAYRRRTVAVAEAPKPPPALQKQVTRAARIIEKHGKVLGTAGLEAVKIATLQIVSKQLADLQALLAHNGLSGVGLPQPQQQAAPPKPTGPTCAICGRKGIYQARHARLAPGTTAPWYCREHAGLDADNISEGPMTPTAKAPPPPPAPVLPPHQASIQGALAALTGNSNG